MQDGDINNASINEMPRPAEGVPVDEKQGTPLKKMSLILPARFVGFTGFVPVFILYLGGKKSANQNKCAVGRWPLILPLFSPVWATAIWDIYQTLIGFFFENTNLKDVFFDSTVSTPVKAVLTVLCSVVCVCLYKKWILVMTPDAADA